MAGDEGELNISAPNPLFVFDGPRPTSVAEERAASVVRARALRLRLELGTGYGPAQMLRADRRAELDALFADLVGALLEQGDDAGVFGPKQLVPASLPAQVLAWVQIARAGGGGRNGEGAPLVGGGVARALALCRAASGRLIGGYLSDGLLQVQLRSARKALPAPHAPAAAAYPPGALLGPSHAPPAEPAGPRAYADELAPRPDPAREAGAEAEGEAGAEEGEEAGLPRARARPSRNGNGGAVPIDSAAWRQLTDQTAARAKAAQDERRGGREAQAQADLATGAEATRRQAHERAQLVRARRREFDARRRAEGPAADAGPHALRARAQPPRSLRAAAAALRAGEGEPPAAPAGSAVGGGGQGEVAYYRAALVGEGGGLLGRLLPVRAEEADLRRVAGGAFVAGRLQRLLRNTRATPQPTPAPRGAAQPLAARWAQLGRTQAAVRGLLAARAGATPERRPSSPNLRPRSAPPARAPLASGWRAQTGGTPLLEPRLRAAERRVRAGSVGAEAARELLLGGGHLRRLRARPRASPPPEPPPPRARAVGRSRPTALDDAERLGRRPAEAVFGGQPRAPNRVPAGGTSISAQVLRARSGAADGRGRIEPVVAALCQLPGGGGATAAALRLTHEPPLRLRRRAAPQPSAQSPRAGEGTRGDCTASAGARAADRAGRTIARSPVRSGALPARSRQLDWVGTPLAPAGGRV